MAELQLTPQVFSILSALVEERAGLYYVESDREIFGGKVAARALEAGFETMLDYYYYLRYDEQSEDEFTALVEALVVHESYLFRELAPLRFVVSDILKPLAERGKRPRLWCAAASSGEEPLTIAMLLASEGLLDKVELVATDLSHKGLARAKQGRYGPRALRRTPMPAFAAPYLRVDEQGCEVDERLRAAVKWQRLNLIDQPAIRALGSFDVILCRNVLIYFRDERVEQVVNSLAERLTPEGALVVGLSESLIRFSTALRCEEQKGVFLYRASSKP